MKSVSKHDSMPMKDLIDVFEQDWKKLTQPEKMVWLKKSKEKTKKVFLVNFHIWRYLHMYFFVLPKN